eukprot:8332468-Pyramimonas_sp.AAC.1
MALSSAVCDWYARHRRSSSSIWPFLRCRDSCALSRLRCSRACVAAGEFSSMSMDVFFRGGVPTTSGARAPLLARCWHGSWTRNWTRPVKKTRHIYTPHWNVMQKRRHLDKSATRSALGTGGKSGAAGCVTRRTGCSPRAFVRRGPSRRHGKGRAAAAAVLVSCLPDSAVGIRAECLKSARRPTSLGGLLARSSV